MDSRNASRLIMLGAIWGASHLFVRIAVPHLGPLWLIILRISLGAALLAGVALYWRRALPWRGNAGFLIAVGALNTAIPFLLLAHAATRLPASLLAILNATAPIWGSLIAACGERRLPGLQSVCGLLLGMAGVALIAGLDRATLAPGGGLAVAQALAATFCYGLASYWIQRRGKTLAPFDVAHGSMWGGLLVLLPCLSLANMTLSVPPGVGFSVLILGLVCTGVAYVMYFRLVEQVGAASALTVTFLVPVFGVLWGALILGEELGAHTFAGMAIVLLGTALATGFLPRRKRR